MYISKTRFINWTRCPLYFPLELKHNPLGMKDIEEERFNREEALRDILASMIRRQEDCEEEEVEEIIKEVSSEELEALLPYYNQVEDEALRVAKKYFSGRFEADYQNVHNQRLFQYEHNGHTYRCYVDIYNETDNEINIIEVKATTCKKFMEMEFSNGLQKENAVKYPLFVKDGNIWRLTSTSSEMTEKTIANFQKKKEALLNRYSSEGKYPHDVAFQKWVIEHDLRKKGKKQKVNYYLAVLNSDYIYDGCMQDGKRAYNEINGQEIITFIDMNETAEAYQPFISEEIERLESYIANPMPYTGIVDMGNWCAWGKNTQCVFCEHCLTVLRNVPKENAANKYLNSGSTNWNKQYKGKYALVNAGIYTLTDIPEEWLSNANHKIQRDCYVNQKEHIDEAKLKLWFKQIKYPIYHFDFESFPCPLPRFSGEKPYQQSCFEFSLHIEREPGVCDKENDNIIFLNQESDTDERQELIRAIVDNFEFNEDGSLKGTMLAQNTSFEISRLKELALIADKPEDKQKLLAIASKTADLIDLLKTKKELYIDWKCTEEAAATINYYHSALSGSYSIKKTLPVLVPYLSYDTMKEEAVGHGVQAYITYLNYDKKEPIRKMKTKEERKEALRLYCQQDTWAMVEILKAVRKKIRL